MADELQSHQQENIPPEKIYVAVGKDIKESLPALKWALQNLENMCSATIILLHIRVRVREIPSPMGRFPVNQISEHMVANYMKEEEKEIHNCMKEYSRICSQTGVKVEILVVEKDDVSKGIVEAISELGIGKLVMGTTSYGHWSILKKMKRPGKADYVQKHALKSCKILIVCKGELVQVSGGSPVSRSPSVDKGEPYFSTSTVPNAYGSEFKDWESAFKETVKEKEELRSHLSLTEQKYEELMMQKDKVLQELQTMGEALRPVESKVNEISLERNAAIKQIHTPTSSSPNIQFTEHSFDDIIAATCNFADHLRLGEGGYGKVFRGEINAKTVAIKILKEGNLQGQKEFQREIDILRNFSHPHMVSIVGACFERGCILYEYMANGCLEDRLFCKNGTPPLPWHARFRIAAEVCSALQFLHTSKPNPIVHRDLKPGNILLDENLISKIGDFGLARPTREDLCPLSEPKGTFYYMDPEYLTTGEFTPKSDVYSFGVVILQLLTGRRARGLVKKVETGINCGDIRMSLDHSAGEWPLAPATELAKVALLCTKQNRNDRPDLHPTVMNSLDRLRTFAVQASNPSARSIGDMPVPSFFLCPIFKEVMHNPYVAADGFTYENEAIKGWFDSGYDRSPVTSLKFEHKNLIPNNSLKSAIRQWQEKEDFP